MNVIIKQQIKAVASGVVLAGEMEGPSWRESSCFFQGEKLELDVSEGREGEDVQAGAAALSIEMEPFTTNCINPASGKGLAFLISTNSS